MIIVKAEKDGYLIPIDIVQQRDLVSFESLMSYPYNVNIEYT